MSSGLAGDNALERAKAAMIIDCIEDMLKSVFDLFDLTEEKQVKSKDKPYYYKLLQR